MKKFKHDYYINNQEDEDASTYPLYPEETKESQKTTGNINMGSSSVTENAYSSRKIMDRQNRIQSKQ